MRVLVSESSRLTEAEPMVTAKFVEFRCASEFRVSPLVVVEVLLVVVLLVVLVVFAFDC